MDLLAAITLGLIGSMHCIGMCGPLILAVPGIASTRWRFIVEKTIYTFGKALIYGIMGTIIGFVGKRFMMNFQQDFSIILGVAILITVAIPFALKSEPKKYSPLNYLYVFIKQIFSSLMKKRGNLSLFVMGMLNGLLPCGLVYTALIGAAVVADVWQSALFMVVFGLGTMPALLVVALTGEMISVKFRSLLTRAIPLFSIVLAVILILRGMNLGIPLISPKVTHTVVHEEKIDCCKE